MSEELKPCDCGGQVEIVSANNCDFRIYCNAERKLKRCWATSKGELIEIWNARPEDNRIAEVEEKLRIKDDVITAKGLLIEALQAKLTATEQKLAKHRWIPVDEGLPHDTKKIIWDFLATTKGTGTIALFKWHPGHCSYVEVNRDCLPMSRDEIKDEFDKWKPITLPEGD